MPKIPSANRANSKHPTPSLIGSPAAHKTKVQLTTWNIQKINPKKCLEHGARIKGHLKGITKLDQPFLIAILENKKEPEAVKKLLREFPSEDSTQKMLETGDSPMGGSTYTQENLVWVSGGGLKVLQTEEWTAWHGKFNTDVNTQVASKQKIYKEHLPPDPKANQGRVVRDTTRMKSIEQIDAMQHPQASHFRNPILLTLKGEGILDPLKVLVVHAPGPGGKELSMPTYAITYMNAVFDAAFNEGIDVVQGDMNFHGEQEFPGYRRLGANEGPTTLTESGEGGSHMDRVYVLAAFSDAAMTVNDQQINLDVTDHRSVKTELPVRTRTAAPDAAMNDPSDQSKDEEMPSAS